MEHESNGDTNWDWCAHYNHKMIGKGTGGIGNKNTSVDHPNYIIRKIGQNTEKSPGDLRRFAATHTTVEDIQLMLVW